MAKLEMECKILAGAESKAFLMTLENLVKRMEAVAGIEDSKKVDADSDVETIDDADEELAPTPAIKSTKGKTATKSFEDDEDATPDAEPEQKPGKKASKKSAALTNFGDEEDDELSSDDAPEAEEDEEEVPPKKVAKTKKLNADDVNDACKERALRTTRAEVLSILKTKFKVKSVSDLEPTQYEAVIKAMQSKR